MITRLSFVFWRTEVKRRKEKKSKRDMQRKRIREEVKPEIRADGRGLQGKLEDKKGKQCWGSKGDV